MTSATIPLEYNVILEPRIEESKFYGNVTIKIEIARETSLFRFDCIGIAVHRASLRQDVGETLDVPYCQADGSIIISPPQKSKKGEVYFAHFEYEGVLKGNLVGFYKSSYTDTQGHRHWLSVTHLEPYGARYVFPCIDEPSIKAKFEIGAIAEPGRTCISNMPVACKQALTFERVLWTFQKSPPMSTYLVALVIGELGISEAKVGDRVISVYTPLGSEREASFGLETAERGLEFFEKLFEFSYQLPKLDLVAIPDFAAGAMENWGLLTFRTTKLLYDSSRTDIDAEKRIADAVLHEISHQWLGNLVAMQTWASLWLKESLATWMAYYAREKLFKTHDAWREFIIERQQPALELDSLRSSHPIESAEDSKEESIQTFDDISYRKGCSVMLMLVKSIGEEAFLEGIRTYLRRHQFGSASSSDFWSAVIEIGQSDISIPVWIRTQGFPVVKVSICCDSAKTPQQDLTQNLQLSQERFLLAGNATSDESDVIYPLQLSIRNGQVVQEVDVQKRKILLPVPNATLLKVNVNHCGFYRTLYERKHLLSLGKACCESWLSVEDRVGLISDASALARAGVQKLSDVLDLIDTMHNDTSYHVWIQITSFLNSLKSAWSFGDRQTVQSLQMYFHAVVERKTGSDGILKNQGLSIDLKALLLKACGNLGVIVNPYDTHQATKRLLTVESDVIFDSLLGGLLTLKLSHGGLEDLGFALRLYYAAREKSDESTKLTILQTFGRVRSAEAVDKVLRLPFSSTIKDQDICIVLEHLKNSQAGALGLWTWFKRMRTMVEKRLAPDLLRDLIPVVLGGLSTEDQLLDAQRFFSACDTTLYGRALAGALELVSIRATWVRKSGGELKRWLIEHGYQ